jgi:CBS domain-containing protein
MLTLVYRCREDSTAAQCAQLMRDENLGFLPVMSDAGAVVGVVTDRDLSTRVLAAQLPYDTPVRQIMTQGPFLTCRPDEDLVVLERRMAQERKSRALVQDERGALIGIISLSDVAQAERSAARTGKLVRDLTRRESAVVLHG